jgi:hypothetical protein
MPWSSSNRCAIRVLHQYSGVVTLTPPRCRPRTQKLVGGPGFEPGASRSRTGTEIGPHVSCRFLQCPFVLNCRGRRVLWCAPVSPRFRESVPRLCPGEPRSAAPARSSANLRGGVWVVARLGNDLPSEGPPTSTT